MPRYRLTRVRKQQSSRARKPALDVYPHGVIPEEVRHPTADALPHDRPRRPASSDAFPNPGGNFPARIAPAEIMALQRLVGNQVVQRLLRERSEDQPAPGQVHRLASKPSAVARTNGAIVQRHARDAMTARSSIAHVGGRVRVGGEAAITAQPDQDRRLGIPEAQCQLDRVVAGVEDKEGNGGITGGEPTDTSFDLLNGHSMGILGRMDPLNVERSRPAIASEAELGEPLVGPASNDGLPVGVAGGMVIEATVRARLGIATRPDADVDGKDALAVLQRVAGHDCPKGLAVERAPAKGRGETTPASPMGRFQAQVHNGRDRPCGEERIHQVEERVAATAEASVQLVAKSAQRGEGIIVWQSSESCHNRAASASSRTFPRLTQLKHKSRSGSIRSCANACASSRAATPTECQYCR